MDLEAVNRAVADAGWTVTIEEDTTVGGGVQIGYVQKTDPDGRPVYTELGDPVMEPDIQHVALTEPTLVIVARRGDETHRFSAGHDEAEIVLALDDIDAETEILAAHERGEHGSVEQRTAGCQRCWEEVWAQEAAKQRHDAVYGGRDPDASASVRRRLGW